MKKFSIVTAMLFAMPFLVSAQGPNITNLSEVFTFINNLFNTLIPLIIAAAVVYFIWGMFQVFLADDTEKKDKAKTTVIYGVISIFVMVSIWGLVNILTNTLGLDTVPKAIPQQLPGQLTAPTPITVK